MADLLTTCPTCYAAQLSACTRFIVIDGGLPTNTDLIARFDLPTGVVDELAITTGNLGLVSIDMSQLPEGYLNTWTGKTIQLSFYDNPAGGYGGAFCDALTFTISGVTYTCIALQPVVCNTVVNVQNIPC